MPLGPDQSRFIKQELNSRNLHNYPRSPYFIQNMGNSHSGHSTTSGSTRAHLYKRKRSIFSRISLGCVASGSSIHSCESDPSIETSKLVLNEKFLHADDIDHPKPCMVPYSPTLAYSPASVNLDEDGQVAFQEFLREYPGKLLLFKHSTIKLTIAIAYQNID